MPSSTFGVKHSCPKELESPMNTAPLPIEELASQLQLQDVRVGGGQPVWLEQRGGKGTLVRWNGVARDLTAGMDVRATVGYGGGDFDLTSEFVVFAHNNVLWRQSLETGDPVRLTPAFGQATSPAISPDQEWVAYVHREDDLDRLAVVQAAGNAWPSILAQGADFYMQPAWSPTGEQLAWVEWDFPAMPWTGSRLMLAQHHHGTLTSVKQIGGSASVGVFQPLFSQNGRWLFFIDNEGETDRLVRVDLNGGSQKVLVRGSLMDPALSHGMRCMSQGPKGHLYLRVVEDGKATLVHIEPERASRKTIPMPYAWISQLHGNDRELVALGESPTCPPRVISWDGSGWTVLRHSSAERHTLALSQPEHVTFETANGRKLFAIHYPPVGGSQVRPKAVINIHGGPTMARVENYYPQAQFLATRGYSVLALNYRGSTGYGRCYREALDLEWGKADVEDARAAADWLRRNHLATEETVAIMGASAGGFTTLLALETYPGVFQAGVSLFGVTDLLGLARRTHKLERRYLDILVGPLPEALSTYKERSPIAHAADIRDPVYLFQGTDDEVVLLSDTERFVASLREHRVVHFFRAYEGEGHGWSKPETIRDFYAELENFLRDTLG